MTKIIGVRFRHAGKLYYFDPDDQEIGIGRHVIVETSRGIECGRVVLPTSDLPEEEVTAPLKKVIRVADTEDEERIRENAVRAKEAFSLCKKKIREHGLDMKLIDAEYTFDHKKVMFYFTADGRVDFRELIKDLASVFRTRIELRQIGVRDETKMLGGLGICGRPVCCGSYMADFIPVSIKMAKEQNLSLNPTKISGVCGRLMCCLKNEQETYEYLNRNLPGIGDLVKTSEGVVGEVQAVNILKQSVRLLIDEDDEMTVEEYSAEGIEILERHKKGRSRKKEREERAERVAAVRAEQARAAEAEKASFTAAEKDADTERRQSEPRRRRKAERKPEPAAAQSADERTEERPAAAAAQGGDETAAPAKKKRRRRHRRKHDKPAEGASGQSAGNAGGE